jgi:hypothetical protein
MEWLIIFAIAGFLLWRGIRRAWREERLERELGESDLTPTRQRADSARKNARRTRQRVFISLDTPCARCGSTGSTLAFSGTDAAPHFYREPLALCLACALAHESFINHLTMLATERRLHFGRSAAIAEAESVWGPRAVDMLALLEVAREDMDQARRILTQESFEEVRPWLEERLGGS